MVIAYSAVAFAMFIWAAVLPTKRALEQRASTAFEDQMRAIELKYARRAYPALAALDRDEIETRFGRARAYRSITPRR